MQMTNSPAILPRAAKPSSWQGCAETLADLYKWKIFLDRDNAFQWIIFLDDPFSITHDHAHHLQHR